MSQTSPSTAQAVNLVCAYALALSAGFYAFSAIVSHQHATCAERLAAAGKSPAVIRDICGRPQ
jgi:hypothetical protein